MNDSIQQVSKLKFFPIMMYAIVMGLGGLTITYQKAHEWLGFPGFLGNGLAIITTFAFIIITLVYILKFIKYKQSVINEFNHPIRINFFAAISISILMLAIIFHPINHTVASTLFLNGTIIHLFLTLYTISFWINKNQVLDHSNPAWFIPIVGNVLIPVAGAGFAPVHILNFFFSIGIFFWIVLFALILNRIIFHHQLAVKFMPTLFILIAPPAVGFIAYFKLYHTIDTFAMMLFNLALFFTLLVAFMYKNFLNIKFFISWWAFVFPLAAMAIASMLLYTQMHDTFLFVFSHIMIAVVTVVIVIVLFNTLLTMKQGEICIQE